MPGRLRLVYHAAYGRAAKSIHNQLWLLPFVDYGSHNYSGLRGKANGRTPIDVNQILYHGNTNSVRPPESCVRVPLLRYNFVGFRQYYPLQTAEVITFLRGTDENHVEAGNNNFPSKGLA